MPGVVDSACGNAVQFFSSQTVYTAQIISLIESSTYGVQGIAPPC